MKALVALVLGAVAITVVNVVAILQGRPTCRPHLWVACAVLTLVCTMVFAALGVFVGYLVPGENAMQVLGPGLALLAFLGNVFIPITEGTTLWHVAACDPDVRRRRDQPGAAHRRPAVVRRGQRRGLAGRLRRRRGVADEQGHGPGLSAGALP